MAMTATYDNGGGANRCRPRIRGTAGPPPDQGDGGIHGQQEDNAEEARAEPEPKVFVIDVSLELNRDVSRQDRSGPHQEMVGEVREEVLAPILVASREALRCAGPAAELLVDPGGNLRKEDDHTDDERCGGREELTGNSPGMPDDQPGGDDEADDRRLRLAGEYSGRIQRHDGCQPPSRKGEPAPRRQRERKHIVQQRVPAKCGGMLQERHRPANSVGTEWFAATTKRIRAGQKGSDTWDVGELPRAPPPQPRRSRPW